MDGWLDKQKNKRLVGWLDGLTGTQTIGWLDKQKKKTLVDWLVGQKTKLLVGWLDEACGHMITLYLLKAFWMILAASYSSLCSPSVSVNSAKSLSIFPLADAVRNSAHAADEGGRSL